MVNRIERGVKASLYDVFKTSDSKAATNSFSSRLLTDTTRVILLEHASLLTPAGDLDLLRDNLVNKRGRSKERL